MRICDIFAASTGHFARYVVNRGALARKANYRHLHGRVDLTVNDQVVYDITDPHTHHSHLYTSAPQPLDLTPVHAISQQLPALSIQVRLAVLSHKVPLAVSWHLCLLLRRNKHCASFLTWHSSAKIELDQFCTAPGLQDTDDENGSRAPL